MSRCLTPGKVDAMVLSHVKVEIHARQLHQVGVPVLAGLADRLRRVLCDMESTSLMSDTAAAVDVDRDGVIVFEFTIRDVDRFLPVVAAALKLTHDALHSAMHFAGCYDSDLVGELLMVVSNDGSRGEVRMSLDGSDQAQQ